MSAVAFPNESHVVYDAQRNLYTIQRKQAPRPAPSPVVTPPREHSRYPVNSSGLNEVVFDASSGRYIISAVRHVPPISPAPSLVNLPTPAPPQQTVAPPPGRSFAPQRNLPRRTARAHSPPVDGRFNAPDVPDIVFDPRTGFYGVAARPTTPMATGTRVAPPRSEAASAAAERPAFMSDLAPTAAARTTAPPLRNGSVGTSVSTSSGDEARRARPTLATPPADQGTVFFDPLTNEYRVVPVVRANGRPAPAVVVLPRTFTPPENAYPMFLPPAYEDGLPTDAPPGYFDVLTPTADPNAPPTFGEISPPSYAPTADDAYYGAYNVVYERVKAARACDWMIELKAATAPAVLAGSMKEFENELFIIDVRPPPREAQEVYLLSHDFKVPNALLAFKLDTGLIR